MIQFKNMLTKGMLIVLVFGTYALTGCGSADSDQTEPDPIPVTVQTAASITPQTAMSFPARVESNNEANLSTIVMGSITEMRVSVGDAVSRGQVIARVRDEQIQAQKQQLDAQMLQANAHLANVERNYQRIKNLFEDDSATQKEMDDISAMYASAKANVAALEAGLKEVNEMLEYTVIRAPFSGVITQKFARSGDMAAPGHPLVTLSDPTDIKITSSVPERLINAVETGMDVSILIKAAGDELLSGTLTNISTAGDPMSRQFSVEARLSENETAQNLRAGMFAELFIETETSQALKVPESALVHRAQLTGLYTINEDNRLVLRWVQTGRKSAGQVEILSGLSAGETFVAEAKQELRQGTIIRTQ